MSLKSRPGRNRLVPFLVLALLSAAPAPQVKKIPVTAVDGLSFISMYDMVKTGGLDSSFDFFTQKGKLFRKERQAAYAVGLSVFIVNGELYKTSYPVRRHKGEVLIPRDAAEKILGVLHPGVSLKRSASVTAMIFDREGRGAGPPDGDGNDGKERKGPVSKADRIGFIVIDPGHGGKDPGALSKGGYPEKTIALGIARMVAAELAPRHRDIKVRLTRSDDRFIELAGRTDIANAMLKKGVNGLFVSIHVNSAPTPKISGIETYYLSQNPSNEEARKTAAFENCVVLLEEGGGRPGTRDDIDYIEAIMLNTQIQRESEVLANSVQEKIISSGKGLKSRGVRKADFFVLRGVLMPAVLVETGFITNKNESRLLKTEAHQRMIARGIALGIEDFMKKYDRMIRGPR